MKGHEQLSGGSNDFTDEALRIHQLLPRKVEPTSHGWEWQKGLNTLVDGKPVANTHTSIVLPGEAPPKVVVRVKDTATDDVTSRLEFKFQPDHTIIVKEGWGAVGEVLDHDDPRAQQLEDALALLTPPREDLPAAS